MPLFLLVPESAYCSLPFVPHLQPVCRALPTYLSGVTLSTQCYNGACRIPLATSHPQLPGWTGNKPLLLVLNRVDMVSPADRLAWAAFFRAQGQPAIWTDAKLGSGVQKVSYG